MLRVDRNTTRHITSHRRSHRHEFANLIDLLAIFENLFKSSTARVNEREAGRVACFFVKGSMI